ncbi:indole-3-glycerol phosphate synthase TrpC [Altibacter sp.]|uniref:indole-3-glycerol phosphate synthase TrpC n=1 Tax=Altibacter sp. TaxID=2024823 RepID=UPI000C948CD4|nr:indole-3-glycerol phosphate synthase TrpC [Altibacter sp.]MAP53556.1 indole-3-glycerol phosphate synthase [Altibacter sp.]
MNILDTIVAQKRKEVAAKKDVFPVTLLERSLLFSRMPRSLAQALRTSKTGIIAEFKRRSPSKSVINNAAKVHTIALVYEQAGVSGISVLTDTPFFGGSLDDLLLARSTVDLPLLRKEFIVDPYQIYEAKAYGADAILLIAACLSEQEIMALSTLAKALLLDVLVEVHSVEELKRSLHATIDMVGVNNRNLKTFEVDPTTSTALSIEIPSTFVKVSESGIRTSQHIKDLRSYGFQGFLIGEQFMKSEDPANEVQQFMRALL